MIENLKQASPPGTGYHHAARDAELVAERVLRGMRSGLRRGSGGSQRRSLHRSLARRRLPGFEGLAIFRVFTYFPLTTPGTPRNSY